MAAENRTPKNQREKFRSSMLVAYILDCRAVAASELHEREMSPGFKSRPLSIVAASMLVGCANAPQPGARIVQIDRTTYGIAHVTASDYEGIGYGVAYAHAQDNLCLTAERLLTLRGDRGWPVMADSGTNDCRPGVLATRNGSRGESSLKRSTSDASRVFGNPVVRRR